MAASLNWEAQAPQFHPDWEAFAARHGLTGWEAWFAPYDEDTYRFVLERLHADDVVLDIGAGDCRFALAAASRVKRVYALEVQPALVSACLQRVGEDLPRNLHVICANALDFPFPEDVTTGVLLMRHCTHFADYFRRLQAVGAQRLFTNARWKMAVEEIDLQASRPLFEHAPPGWYACTCGAVGFKAPAVPDAEVEDAVHEVKTCPQCHPTNPEDTP
ncbi:MAG: class I SAM-dependent methyltransferase [Chloroflexi bacterium]|nr:class I SAM-dependent methyltransferase [Chloroflexota bacterium]